MNYVRTRVGTCFRSAPAGSGKITLLTQWLAERATPVAWLSLDPDDNEPVRFCSSLLAALQQLDPHLGRAALSQLQASPPAFLKHVFTQLANDITDSHPDDFALVLDDYHGITAAPIESEICPPRYNIHTYTLDWKKQFVRLSTVGGKMSIPFTVPHFSSKYQGHKIATADLIYCNGRYWLHVVVSVPEPDIPQNDEVIGVDLGLNRPAVTQGLSL
jgi:hypothetical protein